MTASSRAAARAAAAKAAEERRARARAAPNTQTLVKPMDDLAKQKLRAIRIKRKAAAEERKTAYDAMTLADAAAAMALLASLK